MTRRTTWIVLAIGFLCWWSPQINTGLRYATILILVGFTGIAALLTLRNTAFRRVAAVFGAGCVGLVFAPTWLIPVVFTVIGLTGTYWDVAAPILAHYRQHGRLPESVADHEVHDGQRRDRPADTPPLLDGDRGEPVHRRQHRRQLEPDLDTDSLRNDRWR